MTAEEKQRLKEYQKNTTILEKQQHKIIDIVFLMYKSGQKS